MARSLLQTAELQSAGDQPVAYSTEAADQGFRKQGFGGRAASLASADETLLTALLFEALLAAPFEGIPGGR